MSAAIESDVLFNIYKELPTEKPWKTVETPQKDYTGNGEPQPFPNYARTNDPELIKLWDDHKLEFTKFFGYTKQVLKLMTGNKELKAIWAQGSYNTHYSVTGVAYEEIAETHRKWWKKPKGGVSAPYKKHSLYPYFADLKYKAPKFGDAPTYLMGDELMGPPAFFKHDGYLYFGTRITRYTATDCPWYEDASPWQPIKRWEWEKAKDEYRESIQ